MFLHALFQRIKITIISAHLIARLKLSSGLYAGDDNDNKSVNSSWMRNSNLLAKCKSTLSKNLNLNLV